MKYIYTITFIVISMTLFVCADSNAANKQSTDTLIIPPLLDYTMNSGTKTFDLTVQESSHRFSSKIKAKTLSYGNLSYLGPTIRIKNKDKVAINVINNLKDITTLHQHGIHLPAAADGNVYQNIDRGDTWTAAYTVDQQAGTYWYHPHVFGKTGRQASQGLAGFLIIDDTESEKLDIPHTYGIDDIPLVIQDKSFKRGKIEYEENMHTRVMGNIGKVVITNGTVAPSFTANRSLLRIRLLNGSTFAPHKYSFSDKRSFQLIANDAGFLDAPHTMNSIILAPSERREILVDISDLSKSEKLLLKAEIYASEEEKALEIIAGDFEIKNNIIPTTLVDYKVMQRSQATKKRTITLGNEKGGGGMMGMMNNNTTTINGKSLDLKRVDIKIPLNSTEIWKVNNYANGGHMGNIVHSLHPHSGSFQVLSFNGSPPPPNMQGWKDTIFLLPGETAEIIMEFTDYKGKYMYHCHELEHEDDGMAGIFEII